MPIVNLADTEKEWKCGECSYYADNLRWCRLWQRKVVWKRKVGELPRAGCAGITSKDVKPLIIFSVQEELPATARKYERSV